MEACRQIVGLRLAFNDGVFEVTDSNINALEHYDTKKFEGEDWFKVAWIYWGDGHGSSLYYNGCNRLIVVADHLVPTSTILQEYDVRSVLKESFECGDLMYEEYEACRGKKRRLVHVCT